MKLLLLIERLFIKIFPEKLHEILRFLVAGTIAFSCDFGLLYILTEFLKVFYFISVGLAFLFGLIVVYIINIKWVFRYRSQSNQTKEFLIFALIAVDGLCLNLILVPLFTEKLDFYYMISKALTTIIVLFWNYFFRRYFLFSKTKM